MMLIHFWHGARASEIVGGWAIKGKKGNKTKYFHEGLKPESIQGNYIVFDRLKGSDSCKQELVEHDDELLSERKPLIELARKTPRNQRLFKMCRQHYYRIVRKHAIAVGIPDHLARTTVLKHTLGRLLIKNRPINEVQKRMGHKNLSSTGRYMRVTESEVDAQVVKGTAL